MINIVISFIQEFSQFFSIPTFRQHQFTSLLFHHTPGFASAGLDHNSHFSSAWVESNRQNTRLDLICLSDSFRVTVNYCKNDQRPELLASWASYILRGQTYFKLVTIFLFSSEIFIDFFWECVKDASCSTPARRQMGHSWIVRRTRRLRLIHLSHRRRGATTGFGQNRHHRSDNASIF